MQRANGNVPNPKETLVEPLCKTQFQIHSWRFARWLHPHKHTNACWNITLGRMHGCLLNDWTCTDTTQMWAAACLVGSNMCVCASCYRLHDSSFVNQAQYYLLYVTWMRFDYITPGLLLITSLIVCHSIWVLLAYVIIALFDYITPGHDIDAWLQYCHTCKAVSRRSLISFWAAASETRAKLARTCRPANWLLCLGLQMRVSMAAMTPPWMISVLAMLLCCPSRPAPPIYIVSSLFQRFCIFLVKIRLCVFLMKERYWLYWS